jgi:hypothetical protein
MGNALVFWTPRETGQWRFFGWRAALLGLWYQTFRKKGAQFIKTGPLIR